MRAEVLVEILWEIGYTYQSGSINENSFCYICSYHVGFSASFRNREERMT